MIECKICLKIFSNLKGLSNHIFNSHKYISKEEYYLKYNDADPICICGEKKKFRGFGEGYRSYCSVKCRSANIEPTSYWLNKKQPKSMIDKRIQNTDQTKKEKQRKQTCLKKFGVDNPSRSEGIKEKISKANQGMKCPRKIGHQEKIIATKRKNGTLNHSEHTKEKIRTSINNLYQSDNPPMTIPENNHKNHRTGYFNGQFYRSSYELKFMEYCFSKGIEYISAESKQFRLQYKIDDKNHWYYPDFYLEKYDAIIEIKPGSMLANETVISKMDVAMRNYTYFILTEEELYNLDDFFEELEYEYLHTV